MATNSLCLVVYHCHPFKNHMAFFFPSKEKPDVGTLLHASGDVFQGFALEITFGHDIKDGSTKPSVYKLGEVDAKFLPQGSESYERFNEEETPLEDFPSDLNTMLQIALSVPVPSKGLSSSSSVSFP